MKAVCWNGVHDVRVEQVPDPQILNPHDAIGPTSRRSPIAFSEIIWKPAPRGDTQNLEFIELYNSNPWFHDISG